MSTRILIIEDDEAILKFLRRGLAYEGYQVDTAADGESGLGLARDHPPISLSSIGCFRGWTGWRFAGGSEAADRCRS